MIQQDSKNDDISLIEIITLIRSRIIMIGCVVAVVTVSTALYSLTMPNIFRAEVTILPIGGGGGRAGLISLAGTLGMGSGGGFSSEPSRQIRALLETKTLAEEVVRRFDLASVLAGFADEQAASPSMETLANALLGHIETTENIDLGTISLSAEFQDPVLAAKIANGYMDALQVLIANNIFTRAKRNRLFIQRQLEENKRELLEAGKGLSEFYKSGRVSNVDSEVTVAIDSNGNSGIESFDQQLSVRNVPQQVYLEYLTRKRALLTQVNTVLIQENESARIDEAKEDLIFQVIDAARVPEQRSRPRRTLIVEIALILSLFASIFMVLFLDYLAKNKSTVAAVTASL